MVMEESKDTNMNVYDMKLVMISEKVNKHTRASRKGKEIICPKCGQTTRVYHFSWSALSCQHCNTMIDKYDWELL